MQIAPSNSLLHAIGSLPSAASGSVKPAAKAAAQPVAAQPQFRKPAPQQPMMAANLAQANAPKPPPNLPRGSLLNITV